MPIAVLAALVATQAPVTLLYQPKVGSSYKFAINSTIKTPKGSQSVSAQSSIKILSYTKGAYRVETKLSNVKNGGNSSSDIKDKTTILDYDKYGAVKFDTSGGAGKAGQLMSNFNNQALGMQFPKKPVKVGDTWTNTVDLGGLFSTLMKGGSSAKGTVKLTFKLVQINSKTATVSSTVRGEVTMHIMNRKPGKTPTTTQLVLGMNGSGQYTVDRATGIQQSSNMNMDISTTANGQHVSSNQSVSMKRI